MAAPNGTRSGKFKHGFSHKRNPTYQTWLDMRQRCTNPNSPPYKNYGGRGIKVCNRWLDFKSFLEDMGERPIGLSIDRIDNNGNYEPSNCRWVNHKTQCRNYRRNVIIEYGKKKMCIAEWADFLGIKRKTLTCRFQRGYSIRDALNMRVNAKRYRRWHKKPD